MASKSLFPPVRLRTNRSCVTVAPLRMLASMPALRQSENSMMGRCLTAWLGVTLGSWAVAADIGAAATGAPPPVGTAPARKMIVYVMPVRDQIAQPALYIIRRGLKEAIERKADVVVLDMETPGGALDVTFEIMKALEKFPGLTITYVDKEAMSAGAFISATTQEIWFAPGGIIGAAAPVSATGQDIDETMRLKVVSYLRARVRAVSEGKGYR